MSLFHIGIIGGNGAMGQWFARFFRENGYRVHIADRDMGMGLPDLAAQCAVVIVSVPLGATCEVIAQIGPLMKENALLMDLTSLKTEPVKAMLKASRAEVIGLHPLFGPDITSINGQNIVICPARGHLWRPWLQDLLDKNGARTVVATPEKHDDMMSIIQGLNHLNTILMGLTLKEMNPDPAELDLYSTPAFRTKADMVHKVFEHNPGLYAEIIGFNPQMEKVLKIYEQRLSSLKDLILNKDLAGLKSLLCGK